MDYFPLCILIQKEVESDKECECVGNKLKVYSIQPSNIAGLPGQRFMFPTLTAEKSWHMEISIYILMIDT